ncbi:hypothetical protein EPO44_07665 [bacterium]|nr:MAG: hypothetical protein EPO44_07665 [bacterium]
MQTLITVYFRLLMLTLTFLVFFAFRVHGAVVSRVSFSIGEEKRDALLCRPDGEGPFPTVIFNHGSIVDALGWPRAASRGYSLDAICQTLAEDGFLALAPIREKVPRGRGYMSYDERYREVVARAIDHVKTLRDADPSRIALMGFSMGGLTSLKVAVERTDLKAVLLLAPAWGRGLLADEVQNVPSLNAPVLLLVEAGDEPQILKGVAVLGKAFQAHKKEVRIIRYNRGGGHELFYKVDYYWVDVRDFLREKLGGTPASKRD